MTSIEEAIRSGAVRLLPVEVTPDMSAAGEVALVDVLHGVYYIMPNGGMRRVLRSAIAASPDHTPALLALIEERDRLKVERDGAQRLATEHVQARFHAEQREHNAHLAVKEERELANAAEARALAAEAKRDALREALSVLFEWYESDGSVGGASEAFERARALTQETNDG